MRRSTVPPADLVGSVSRALRVLEAVGEAPQGLSPKQVARRCELTPAAAYRMLRTLAHHGYVRRRSDGAFSLGLAVADRFRQFATEVRGPAEVGEVLRKASCETGYSFYLAGFLDDRVAITAVSEGPRSPYVEDLVVGFDEGAHATAVGKSLLATLGRAEREQYLREQGMRPFTQATLRSPGALEADLAAGLRRGMQMEVGQFRSGVACVSVVVNGVGEASQRFSLGCSLPAADVTSQGQVLRERLAEAARALLPLVTAARP